MTRELRTPLLVLAPAAVGFLLRLSDFMTSNRAITQSAGQVHPAEVAYSLARGDELLAISLIVSIAAALVWLWSTFSRSRAERVACGLVLLGLVIAVGGTRQLSATNSELSNDFERTVVAHSSLDEEVALDRAHEAYSASYDPEGPVHSSTQFAAVVPQLEGTLSAGNSLRLLGLGLVLAAALFKIWRGARWERTDAAGAS